MAGVLTEQDREGYIRALLEERRSYVAQGWEARVAEVDAELKRVGASAEPERKAAAKRKAKA